MGAGGALHLWNEWAAQILVLLSLTLQVVLLLLAWIRRRRASALLRFFLWLAYLLADSTAIYAVGHLSLSSSPREHQLVAFWAPFLLLHLGGPDNITAYSLEDNKLWNRHLLTLGVQVLGAVYVLYKHIARSGPLLVVAAVLMLLVGVVKYGERIWALWRAKFSSIRSSLKEEPHYKHQWYQGYLLREDQTNVADEFLLQRAHSLFHICKRGIVDSVSAGESESRETDMINRLMKEGEKMWTVMEMELSLMYDVLYTKASVIHTLVGYCIRLASPIAVVAAFLLFQFSGKDGHNRVDVIITYVLLGGAFVLETTSLLSAVGSSWTLAFLCTTRWGWLRHAALCAGRWHRLRGAFVHLRWLAKIMTGRRSSLYGSRRWSGTMGQYNMLHFRTAQLDPTISRLRSLAKMLRFSEWWDKQLYSWTVSIPDGVKERTKNMVTPWDLNTMGMLRHKWGEIALDDKKRPGLFKKLEDWHGVDFHESIISWHLATDLFLMMRSRQAKAKEAAHLVEAIRALSHYMMFLLVNRPDMLPGLPQNWLYQQTCSNLDQLCEKYRESRLLLSGSTSVFTVLKKLFRSHDRLLFSRLEKPMENLAGIILDSEESTLLYEYDKFPRLAYAREIARVLLREAEDPVDVLLDVWTDFLVYAANRCSRESHAKKLNSGAEFTTVIWLLIEHIYQTKRKA